MSEKRKLTVPRGRSPEFIAVTKLTTARPLPAALFGLFQVCVKMPGGPMAKQSGSQGIRIEVETVEHSGGAIGAFDRGQGDGDVLDTDMSMTQIQRRPQSALEDVLGPAR